jgi:hypothetical protein
VDPSGKIEMYAGMPHTAVAKKISITPKGLKLLT